ncbi:MAG: D-Ala-D-Ala carboxypeptidase family metallohydrolase [Deltaproteobacteria bacterium]|nr:D-Ala-D-Ala carboxypeptidase family metallohydrolase [Deltaproteobacteria bacterium]
MGDLSPHFCRKEFACHCCGGLPLYWVEGEIPPLVAALEQLRALAGQPVVVVSGYRCRKHNAEVGGEKNSQHLLGKAADIHIPGKSLREVYKLACKVRAFKNGGIGVYPNQGFVHVDVRQGQARWGQLHGRYVAIEEALEALP